jgi:hypothetical protein
VLVEQVDPVGTQPLQHRVDGLPDVIGAAVGSASALAGLRVDIEAELGGDDHLVAHRLQGFPDDAFGLERTVGFCSVEKRHTLIDRRADEGDHVGAAGDRTVELSGHRLAAQPRARNLQRAQLAAAGHGGGRGYRVAGVVSDVAARVLVRLAGTAACGNPGDQRGCGQSCGAHQEPAPRVTGWVVAVDHSCPSGVRRRCGVWRTG